jgi:hypothetical protein
VFPVVWVVGVAIWHDHLSKRDAPEHLRIFQSDMLVWAVNSHLKA